jgi:hypothetical protein
MIKPRDACMKKVIFMLHAFLLVHAARAGRMALVK